MRQPFLPELEIYKFAYHCAGLYSAFTFVISTYRYVINLHQRAANQQNDQQRLPIYKLFYQAAVDYKDNLYEQYNRSHESVHNVRNAIVNAPHNIKNVINERIMTLTSNIRNTPDRLKDMITARPINKITAIATWLHGIYLYRNDPISRLTDPTSKIFFHIVNLYYLSYLTNPAVDFVRKEIPNFARRVRHHGLQPIHQLLSFKSVIAMFFTLQHLYTVHHNKNPQLPASIYSPVALLGFSLIIYNLAQTCVNHFEQSIGRVVGHAADIYHSFWNQLGYLREQPVSNHNFDNMEKAELTCIITRYVPSPDNAVIIANDPRRQVYDREALVEWVNQPHIQRNIKGEFANPVTNVPYFSRNHIIPAPEAIKEQIKAYQESEENQITAFQNN